MTEIVAHRDNLVKHRENIPEHWRRFKGFGASAGSERRGIGGGCERRGDGQGVAGVDGGPVGERQAGRLVGGPVAKGELVVQRGGA